MTPQQKNQEPTQGWKPDLSDHDRKLAAIEAAFNYRGDITLTLTNGESVTGFLFDRHINTTNPENSFIRMMKIGTTDKTDIPVKNINEITFSGKDTAAGKSWEHWIKTYTEKKKQGLTAELHPDNLEDEHNTPTTNK